MSSRKQRDKNRQTAKRLRHDANTCTNCGERGMHWVVTDLLTLQDIVNGAPEEVGFWICAKYYDASGRRILGRSA